MKITKIVIVFLVLLFCLCGCGESGNELQEKVKGELDYVDIKLISMINTLNNISLENYSIVFSKTKLNEKTSNSSGEKQGSSGDKGGQNGGQEKNQNQSQEQEVETTEMKNQTILGTSQDEIKWDLIKSEIEILNDSWDVILLDLYSINNGNEDIIAFSDKLNETIISISEENKANTLNNLKDLYSYIPKFMASINADGTEQKIKQAKFYLINSYAKINEDNWDGARNELAKCKSEFENISGDNEYAKNKEYKISKISILVNEIENSISSKNKKVFYIKYKNLLKSINSV